MATSYIYPHELGCTCTLSRGIGHNHWCGDLSNIGDRLGSLANASIHAVAGIIKAEQSVLLECSTSKLYLVQPSWYKTSMRANGLHGRSLSACNFTGQNVPSPCKRIPSLTDLVGIRSAAPCKHVFNRLLSSLTACFRCECLCSNEQGSTSAWIEEKLSSVRPIAIQTRGLWSTGPAAWQQKTDHADNRTTAKNDNHVGGKTEPHSLADGPNQQGCIQLMEC